MSDDQKMKPLDLELTPKGKARAVALKVLRTGGDVVAAIAEALEAYSEAQSVLGVVERVTLLEPKPGDVVMIQLRENATMEQIGEFAETMAKALPPSCDQVHFVGARCLAGVQVVRPAPEAEEAKTDGQ